jgi:hypothetical protein
MSFSIAAQFPFLIGILASGILCGAWWYAALRKRKVAIFFWLAAGHTITFGIHAISVGSYLMSQNFQRMAAVASMQTLMSVVMAGLYVALVRWLVEQPDSTGA